MSQSPIRLQAIDKSSGAVDAIPLAQPQRLFECLYKPGKIGGCFEGEPGHANFVVQNGKAHVRFRGVSYELKKIHIHGESEHIVGQDDPHDMEIHLVHAPVGSPVASPLVVIGILFSACDREPRSKYANAAFREFLKGAETKVCVELDPLDLFPRGVRGKPDTKEWFHYEGSLTGYPYSENVSWIVMRNPSTIDQSIVEEFVEHAEQHRRELQPLDRRLVVRSFLDTREM